MKPFKINAPTVLVGGYHAERRQALVTCLSPLISGRGGQRRKSGRTRLIDCIGGGIL